MFSLGKGYRHKGRSNLSVESSLWKEFTLLRVNKDVLKNYWMPNALFHIEQNKIWKRMFDEELYILRFYESMKSITYLMSVPAEGTKFLVAHGWFLTILETWLRFSRCFVWVLMKIHKNLKSRFGLPNLILHFCDVGNTSDIATASLPRENP